MRHYRRCIDLGEQIHGKAARPEADKAGAAAAEAQHGIRLAAASVTPDFDTPDFDMPVGHG